MVRREMRAGWWRETVDLGKMQYSVYAVLGVCRTQCMQYSVYAELSVCSTRCMLYLALTHDQVAWRDRQG